MKDAVSTVLPHARKKRLIFVCEPPANLPKIHCDREKIRQCLINLVSNAVKFTPAGGTVKVGADVAGERVALFVADSGIGIPPEHLGKVWDVFYQVDGSTTR